MSKTPALSVKWKAEIRRRSLEVDHDVARLPAADGVFKKAMASL